MQARILIVDDDPQIRKLLSEFLDGYGFSCKLAADGEEMRRVLARTGGPHQHHFASHAHCNASQQCLAAEEGRGAL